MGDVAQDAAGAGLRAVGGELLATLIDVVRARLQLTGKPPLLQATLAELERDRRALLAQRGA